MAMLDIGSTKQLFIDDYIIESLTNAKQGLNPAVKVDHNPILRQERPWEGDLLDVGKVLFDERDHSLRVVRAGSTRQEDQPCLAREVSVCVVRYWRRWYWQAV